MEKVDGVPSYYICTAAESTIHITEMLGASCTSCTHNSSLELGSNQPFEYTAINSSSGVIPLFSYEYGMVCCRPMFAPLNVGSTANFGSRFLLGLPYVALSGAD